MWRFLKNLEIELPYDPEIPLLGIQTKETRIERDTCTLMFIAALFTITRTWKQPRYPLADEWIRKLWYVYTMEYYSAIKKNSFESVLMRWMKLEPAIQSEVSQKGKHQYSILMHIYGIYITRCSSWFYKRQRNQRSNCQHLLDHQKSKRVPENIYFSFIDYAKDFDCVDHNKLWKILKEMGTPDHLTYLLRNLYAGQESTVRTGHGTKIGSK